MLDLQAASWPLDTRLHAFLIDDDERWRLGDAAAAGEIGPRVVVDSKDAERVVVMAPLQDLGEKPLHPPRQARAFAVEEEQLRPGDGGLARRSSR